MKGFLILKNFWLCWVFVAAHGCSLVVAHRGFSSCGARLLLFWTTRYRACWLSNVVSGLSCPSVCEILVLQLGTEPESPALEGGFLTKSPSGKSPERFFKKSSFGRV